jgi:hypothetical protein
MYIDSFAPMPGLEAAGGNSSGIRASPPAPSLLPHLTYLAVLGSISQYWPPPRSMLEDAFSRLPNLNYHLVVQSHTFRAADVESGMAVVAGQLTRLTLRYEIGAGDAEMMRFACANGPTSRNGVNPFEASPQQDSACATHEIKKNKELLSELLAVTASGTSRFTALRVLELRNLTINDKGWEAMCAVLATQPGGPAFPCLTRVTAQYLDLEHSHASRPCGSLCSVAVSLCDTRALKHRLPPALKLTSSRGGGCLPPHRAAKRGCM